MYWEIRAVNLYYTELIWTTGKHGRSFEFAVAEKHRSVQDTSTYVRLTRELAVQVWGFQLEAAPWEQCNPAPLYHSWHMNLMQADQGRPVVTNMYRAHYTHITLPCSQTSWCQDSFGEVCWGKTFGWWEIKVRKKIHLRNYKATSFSKNDLMYWHSHKDVVSAPCAEIHGKSCIFN